jgi:hypothetical protein
MREEIERNPKALDQAKQKLREWERQGLITADQAKRTSGEFDELASSVRKVPGSKHVAVGTSGINKAKVELASVKSQMDRIQDKTVNLHFAATGLNAIKIAESKLLGFAEGGEVPGPRGAPQLAVVHGGERVLSLADQAKMTLHGAGVVGAMTGTGGGATYVDSRTVTYQVTSNDPQAVVEAIKKYERTNGPAWRA